MLFFLVAARIEVMSVEEMVNSCVSLDNQRKDSVLLEGLRKTLLTKVIPNAEQNCELTTLALCLQSRDPDVCDLAGRCLEQMFLCIR
jgi:hypothetical protein